MTDEVVKCNSNVLYICRYIIFLIRASLRLTPRLPMIRQKRGELRERSTGGRLEKCSQGPKRNEISHSAGKRMNEHVRLEGLQE